MKENNINKLKMSLRSTRVELKISTNTQIIYCPTYKFYQTIF